MVKFSLGVRVSGMIRVRVDKLYGHILFVLQLHG